MRNSGDTVEGTYEVQVPQGSELVRLGLWVDS
jgi:hypothetical protein